ncbi:hypothetical protein PLCT2_01641 [Planctomycetaceae bacterium]|nr:hypothetical protein PLCT2_01641 [Planctomycetaceae bacterium]
MIASLQKKATPFLGLGLLIQVGGSFLREINWGLTLACLAIGAALLIVGCMYYAVGKGYRRELGLLGLLSVFGVIALIYLPDKEKDAPPATADSELPVNTTEAFKDDKDVQEALASITAMPFSAASAGKVTPLEIDDLDTEPNDDDFEKPAKKPGGSAPPKGPVSIKASGVQAASSKKAREAVLGETQGEIVPSRLLYQRAGKLTFTCQCGKRYKVDTSRAGEMMMCRYCKKHLLVPVPELKT